MGALEGKIAVVTGASRGIGKGTARALGEQGCIVYVTGRTTGEGDRTIDETARLVPEAPAARWSPAFLHPLTGELGGLLDVEEFLTCGDDRGECLP